MSETLQSNNEMTNQIIENSMDIPAPIFEKHKTLSVRSIRPSPENNKLYKKIRTTDPDIAELADSIEKNGLLEPIIVTKDYFIISGHRRFASIKRLGFRSIECVIRDCRKDEDHERFIHELREANRQRVKTIDEILCEQVINMRLEWAVRSTKHSRKYSHTTGAVSSN